MTTSATTPPAARTGRNELAAALARGPVEVLDFFLPLWAGEALDLSPAAVGALAATETAVSLPTRPVAGVLTDRTDRGRLAAGGAFLYALAFAGYALAGGLGAAMMAAVACGVGSAVFWIALRARVAEGLAADSGAFSRLFAAEGTGTWIAFVAALTLVSRVGYHGVFWFGAAACAAAGVVLLDRTPANAGGEAGRTLRLGQLGRRMWPLLGVVALTAVAESGVALLLLLHLQRGHGLELGAIAAVFLPGFLVYSTVPEFLHSAVTRLGRAQVMTAALVSSALFAVVLVPAPSPWVLAVAWVLAAVAFAAAVPVEQAVVAEAAGLRLGQGMAVYESATLLGTTVGVLGAGVLYGVDGGRELACVVAAVLLLAAAVLVRPALRGVGAAERPPPPAPPAPEPPTAALREVEVPTAAAASSAAIASAVPTDGPAAAGADRPESALTSTRGWVAHVGAYAAAQIILAFTGQSWPVEAVAGGPHDAEWFWNSSGDRLLNADRIWTAVFLLDTVWTGGRFVLRRLRR